MPRRLKAAGYAEGANEGRTRRYYENAEGRAYLKFVLDEIMRRERSHQLWFYSVMSGFWKLIDMDKVQLTLDKFPPVSNVDFFRRLSPWVKTIREAGTDVQLIQLITMNEDWLTARDAIITFTDQVLGMLQSLVNEMLWIPAIELLF